MKRCPTCNRTFNDDSLSFCLDDGTPLAFEGSGPDSEATLVSPSPRPPDAPGMRDTQAYNQLPGRPTYFGSQGAGTPSYVPPPKRKAWPWVLAIVLLVLFALGVIVVAAVVIPQLNHSSSNGNSSPSPSPIASPSDEPVPSPVESPSAKESDVPTDADEVQSAISDLEDQWTEANWKGDKTTLERILADDYRGGPTHHGKQEYIRELRPETNVKSWDIDDLDVTLKGDRVIARGVLIQETNTGTQTYRFTDTFVWRDHRWQAIASVATRVE